MKLMRNDPKRAGICKYALIRTDNLTPDEMEEIIFGGAPAESTLAAILMKRPDLIEFGDPRSPEEFFAIKLKDRYAAAALFAYAEVVRNTKGDEDLARDVYQLSSRAGPNHPKCKLPD